ncbi:MAG: DNA repair protein RecN [Chitinivibrionales bacterium]|nr:DNA repair protein RecN [Chitinivibrionales bacterium]
MTTAVIRELRVKNLALIEDLAVEFDDGFSVFTGETGAGKSILIGAIGLLLGDRASTESVRSGADDAEICGVFDLPKSSDALRELLEENTIEISNQELIIRRKITRHGKNRIYLNQVPIPLTLLGKVGELLIDFHSQHEHQSLLLPETAPAIIDSLSGVAPAKEEYESAYAEYFSVQSALEKHDRKATALKERRDILEYQFKEISNLNLKADEEVELEAELKLITSSTERLQLAADILELTGGGSNALSKAVVAIRKKLENLSRFDQSAVQWIADIENTQTLFSELETYCESYGESFESAADPARIEFINDRIARIQRLKKKYGCSSLELLERAKQLKADLDSLENCEADRKLLEKQVDEAHKKAFDKGNNLHRARQKAAREFDKKISAQMNKLGFKDGEWQTALKRHSTLTPLGLEDISFLVKTNPGEPALPLVKIASGGEISRLMLAIKSVLAEKDRVSTLIFDEIDAGIGGVLAKEVARALRELSGTHQVICISHLHQIASVADHHFHVYKEIENKRTRTRIKRLEGAQKVDEIARMFGDDSEISRKHAQELLKKK